MQRDGVFITLTEPDEIFVFGSNAEGIHAGGAARYAIDNYGAKMGQALGLQGRSYGIDTMSGYTVMKKGIEKLIEFARYSPEYRFIVTPIGCGIAGYLPKEIAPLFDGAPDNVVLPEEFTCLKVM